MYEGAPDWPERDRFWRLIERYGVTDPLHRADGDPRLHEVGQSIPTGTTSPPCGCWARSGEPINPEAWIWYHKNIGGGRCPIVDTWWQTETGGIMITPLPGVTTTKPGSATMPFPGIVAELVDANGQGARVGRRIPHPRRSRGPACCARSIGDDERYQETYWSRFPGRYFTGDGAKLDEDGYWWILGRVDDVLNVAGHRIGTMEVESALVDHPAVAEAAVVGRAHELKGQALAAFVTLKEGHQASRRPQGRAQGARGRKIGAIARPDDIFFSADLPKTRSGKIMRRLLKDIAEGPRAGRHDDAGRSGRGEQAEGPVRVAGGVGQAVGGRRPRGLRPFAGQRLSHRNITLQIRVPLEPGHVVGDEAVRLLPGEVLGRAHLAAERRQQIGRAELHVVQHLGHRVAVDQVGDLVALLGQPDVHRVGVAEQVVQVAEDLLVRAGEKDAEDVRLALVAPDAARATACPSGRRRSGRSCRPSRR